MKNSNGDLAHRALQDNAGSTWWAAYYPRKGHLRAAAEEAAGQILCETMLPRDSVLSEAEYRQIETQLSDIAAFGIQPYGTPSGETIATPYLISDLLAIAPQQSPVSYALLTY